MASTGLWSDVETAGRLTSDVGLMKSRRGGIDFQSTRSQYEGILWSLYSVPTWRITLKVGGKFIKPSLKSTKASPASLLLFSWSARNR